MDDNSLKFINSFFIWIGLAISIILIIFYFLTEKKRQTILAKFIHKNMLTKLLSGTSTTKRRLKHIILITTVFLIFLTLARPYYGYKIREIKRKGIDILLALDVSKSMLVKDISPNRLERAKMSIKDFTKKIKTDRIGLILFSGKSFLNCPLTLDYNAFLFNLEAASVGVIQEGGTNISSALWGAIQAFGETNTKEKILILITDGENLQGSHIETAKKVKNIGLKVFTIGVGTKQGELIPTKSYNGKTSFLKDSNGKYIKSSLDEKTLNQISQITNAQYYPLGQLGEGLNKIYENHLSKLQKKELKSREKKLPIEKYQIPILLIISLLFLELIISDRKKIKNS